MTIADRRLGTRPPGPANLIWLTALVATFAGLTWLVSVNPVLDIDVGFERALQAFHPTWLDPLTQAISWVGFPPQSTIIDAVIVVAIFFAGKRWEAICAAIAAGGSAATWFLLTPLIHRPRPATDLVRVQADIPFGSFPSGHVMNLTAFFGFLAFLALTRMRPGPLRTACVTVCALLIVAIGYARIYSGEHWPSDVLAGYVLGAAWLLLSISLYRWRAHR